MPNKVQERLKRGKEEWQKKQLEKKRERLEKAAEEVLGRKVKMVFDGDDGADTQTAESDPVSDFLTKAESMGVKIKYKKSKN